MSSEIKCPVCNGSRRMEIVEFIGVEKKRVKVPCTACVGRGKISFVDKSKPMEVKKTIETIAVETRKIGGGWRSSVKGNKTHYIRDGRSLCGNIRSRNSISRSTPVDDMGYRDLCAVCVKVIKSLIDMR